MKMLNKVVPALLFLPCAALADIEFGDNIPREVVEQLLGSPLGGEPKLYSDMFAAFPPFEVPAGFELLASADQGMARRVILRTTLDDAAASAAIVAALLAEGWVELPVYNGAAANTGFIGVTPPVQFISLCNDAHGRMSISVNASSGAKYVSLAQNPLAAFAGQRRSCAEEVEMITRGPMRFGGAGLAQYMPALVMPRSDVPGADQRGLMGSGGGGSGNDYETRSFLAITWSGDALLGHFATQITEQGWQPEAQTSDASTAFGSWTKRIDGNEYRGLLTLVETADDGWDLKFRILRYGTGGAGAVVQDIIVN